MTNGQTNEERFTGINPEELDPQLQQLYKMMQADYTRKRREESARVKEIEGQLGAYQNALAERDKVIEEVKPYVASLEDANLKWQQWHNVYGQNAEASLNTTQQPTGQPQGQQSFTSAQQSQGAGSGGMTNREQEILSHARSDFSPEQIAKLDDYFTKKYGQSMSELNSELTKVKTQLHFTNQLSDITSSYGDKIKIDKDRIYKKAIELGKPDAMEAFKAEYGNELMDVEVNKRVEATLKEREESSKKTILEGISKPAGNVYYQRPTETPRSYEEARQQILTEEAVNQ